MACAEDRSRKQRPKKPTARRGGSSVARGAGDRVVCVQGGRGRPGRASSRHDQLGRASGASSARANFFVELVCGAALGAHPLSPRMMTLSKTFLRAAMPGAS